MKETLWDYEEQSTRNCVHCKVRRDDTKKYSTRAICELGKTLRARFSKVDKNSMPLRDVLRNPSWFGECENCLDFEHDISRVSILLS